MANLQRSSTNEESEMGKDEQPLDLSSKRERALQNAQNSTSPGSKFRETKRKRNAIDSFIPLSKFAEKPFE